MKRGGQGGFWPHDFTTIALCDRFHLKPWELDEAPAFWVHRMALYMNVEVQAERDRQANDDAAARAQEQLTHSTGGRY